MAVSGEQFAVSTMCCTTQIKIQRARLFFGILLLNQGVSGRYLARGVSNVGNPGPTTTELQTEVLPMCLVYDLGATHVII